MRKNDNSKITILFYRWLTIYPDSPGSQKEEINNAMNQSSAFSLQ